MIRRRYLLPLLLILSLGYAAGARGQAQIEVAEPIIAYTFGQTLTIESEVQTQTEIAGVRIHLTQPETTEEMIGAATLTPEGILSYTLNLQTAPLVLFSPVDFWFEFTLESGETVVSQRFSFMYEDNRFSWQTLETEEFSIHWYGFDQTLAGTVLNSAYEALARFRLQVELPQVEHIHIYIYATTEAFQATLPYHGPGSDLIAGHANPLSNRVMVSLPAGPSQTLEIQRQIPHELGHVLLAQALGENYSRLPAWLSEGLATSLELFPNPDYPLVLNTAYEQGALLPMTMLCESFPLDAARFQLSYAQSASFTRYLMARYGDEGLRALLQAYSDGLSCEYAPEAALNRPLSVLESDWRRVTFNESPWKAAGEAMLPWLCIALAFIVFPTLVLLIRRSKTQEEVKVP